MSEPPLDPEIQRALYEAFHHGKCPTEGCLGDERYAAPGRGHIKGCTYPRLDPPTYCESCPFAACPDCKFQPGRNA